MQELVASPYFNAFFVVWCAYWFNYAFKKGDKFTMALQGFVGIFMFIRVLQKLNLI